MKFTTVILLFSLILSCSASSGKNIAMLKKDVSKETNIESAIKLVEQNKLDDAQKILQSINLDSYSNAYEVTNYLGLIYTRKNQLDSAQLMFRKSINYLYDFDQSHNNLGYIYMMKERYDLAIEEFETALRINPDYDKAQKNRELVLQLRNKKIDLKTIELFNAAFKIENLDEQIKSYEAFIAKNPQVIEAYNNLAVCYFYKGRIIEAESVFREVLDKNPKYVEAYNNIGFVLFVRKKYDLASRYFLTSIKLKPTYTIALTNLGDLFFEQKNYPNARKVWTTVLQVEPKNKYVLDRLDTLNKVN